MNKFLINILIYLYYIASFLIVIAGFCITFTLGTSAVMDWWVYVAVYSLCLIIAASQESCYNYFIEKITQQ